MPSQVKRLLILFAIAAALLVVSRIVLMPETFGVYGHYRAAAVDEDAGSAIRYAGHLECLQCHEDVAAVKTASAHAPVACEACHGPAYAHTQDPLENKPDVPRERRACLYCHGYDLSRPTGFPQVDPEEHGGEEACIACHNSHQPEPPADVETCDACHRTIELTKSASRHSDLDCTTCHDTPDGHLQDPRSARPGKPRTRDFCAQCHADDGSATAVGPQVDILTHGEDYVCWQCHDPHHPEGGR